MSPVKQGAESVWEKTKSKNSQFAYISLAKRLFFFLKSDYATHLFSFAFLSKKNFLAD